MAARGLEWEALYDTLRVSFRKALPALAIYGALTIAYLLFEAKSQLIASILFYALLGGAFNIFMGMTG